MRGLSIWLFIFFLVAQSCTVKEPVVLRAIENIEIAPGQGTEPILKADALFYNPNRIRMRVKGIVMEVFIDDKKAAYINQKLSSIIKAESDFTLPLEVQLSLKEFGLVNALASLFGGKKYELHYVGHIKVSVKGLPLKIPVDYKREVKLRF